MAARRVTQSWRALCLLVIAGALLAVAGCSGGGSPRTTDEDSGRNDGQPRSVPSPTLPPRRSPPQWPVVASAKGEELRVEVNRVRSDSYGFTMVHWTVTNISSNAIDLRDFFHRRDYSVMSGIDQWYMGPYMAGVELVSRDQGQIYLPLTDPKLDCVCSKSSAVLDNASLAPGNYIRGYTAYFIPPDSKTISVSFPGFELLKNIPIKKPRAASGN